MHSASIKVQETQEAWMEALHSSTPSSYQDVVFGSTS